MMDRRPGLASALHWHSADADAARRPSPEFIMKIYLASSWRNRARFDQLDPLLTAAGHECFNFTNPGSSTALPNGIHWSEIDPTWQSWTPEQYRLALEHPWQWPDSTRTWVDAVGRCRRWDPAVRLQGQFRAGLGRRQRQADRDPAEQWRARVDARPPHAVL
jgi:hypothetical protein